MKNNNKGFTLVEIMIAIAIISVVSSMSVMGYQSVHNANVSNTANKINSYLSAIRMNNMSKVNMQYLHLYRVDDSDYYSIDNNTSIDFNNLENRLGSGPTSMFYTTNNEKAIVNNNGLTITFNRAGEVKLYNRTGGVINQELRNIAFANNSRTVSVKVVPGLGKTYIK